MNFFISTKRIRDGSPIPGKGRRVENYQIKSGDDFLVRLCDGLGLEPVKDVDRLERTFFAQPISVSVLDGSRDGLFILFETMHVSCSAPCRVQSKTSQETKTVQHLSSRGELSDERVILLLIQVQAGLVTLQQIRAKKETVQLDVKFARKTATQN